MKIQVLAGSAPKYPWRLFFRLGRRPPSPPPPPRPKKADPVFPTLWVQEIWAVAGAGQSPPYSTSSHPSLPQVRVCRAPSAPQRSFLWGRLRAGSGEGGEGGCLVGRGRAGCGRPPPGHPPPPPTHPHRSSLMIWTSWWDREMVQFTFSPMRGAYACAAAGAACSSSYIDTRGRASTQQTSTHVTIADWCTRELNK